MRTEPYKNLEKYLTEPYKTIWEIGNATGLRISDILTLKVKHLKIEKPTIKERKTGKSKRIRIPTKTRKRLIAWTKKQPENNYIFSSDSTTGHLTRQAVFKAFKKASKQAGTKNNVGTHTMRKNYALRQYNKGGIKYVQTKLNHDNIAESALYLLKGKDEENEHSKRMRKNTQN